MEEGLVASQALRRRGSFELRIPKAMMNGKSTMATEWSLTRMLSATGEINCPIEKSRANTRGAEVPEGVRKSRSVHPQETTGGEKIGVGTTDETIMTTEEKDGDG